ncbi:MAG: sulfotransferase [Myxococcales bacterium]|nr:sulfotransferase [Myxococcales bacterium]
MSPAPGTRAPLDTVRLHWLLRGANRVGRLLAPLGLRPSLDAAAIEARARKLSGLDDFGDPGYRDGLERLCAELDTRAGLHLAGRLSARDHLVRGLGNRLGFTDARRRDPSIATAPLIPPLVVVGLPRSGTTFLHRVLCHAPDALPPVTWQLLAPLPPASGPDRRRAQGARTIGDIRRAAPGIDAKHYLDHEQPEECMMLLDASMASLTYGLLFPVPDYIAWLFEHDATDDYRYWRDGLVHLQRGAPDRRLTLKAPVHTAFVDAIWHHVPDALIIHPHRDPAAVVGSLCSLFFTFHSLVVDAVDRDALGASMLAMCERMMQRNLDARAKHPDKVIVDVRYRTLMADPVGTVLSLYERHGLPVTPALEAAIADGIARRPQHAHGRHDYALEDFGLTAAGVRARLDPLVAPFLRDAA